MVKNVEIKNADDDQDLENTGNDLVPAVVTAGRRNVADHLHPLENLGPDVANLPCIGTYHLQVT